MATKTFKIGEYAVGGIIKVSVNNGLVTIQALDWNTKEIVEQEHFKASIQNLGKMLRFLESDLTSYYYADQIMPWIREQMNVPKNHIIWD